MRYLCYLWCASSLVSFVSAIHLTHNHINISLSLSLRFNVWSYPVSLMHSILNRIDFLLLDFSILFSLIFLVFSFFMSYLNWVNMIAHVLGNLFISKLRVLKQLHSLIKSLIIIFWPPFNIALLLLIARWLSNLVTAQFGLNLIWKNAFFCNLSFFLLKGLLLV